MTEREPIDPYQPPASDVAGDSSNQGAVGKERRQALLAFFSTSGSFSQRELLMATVILLAIWMLFSTLHRLFPEVLSRPVLLGLQYCLYGLWGIALGKRSRDLGTTFTYGMVVGLIFPVIGVVFLFQQGAKARARRGLSAVSPKP